MILAGTPREKMFEPKYLRKPYPVPSVVKFRAQIATGDRTFVVDEVSGGHLVLVNEAVNSGIAINHTRSVDGNRYETLFRGRIPPSQLGPPFRNRRKG
jgi:hypothetical protein